MPGLWCALCGGELRPTSLTSEGRGMACPCGRTVLAGALAQAAVSSAARESRGEDTPPPEEEER